MADTSRLPHAQATTIVVTLPAEIDLAELAQDRSWTVQIIATPSALAFIDTPKLEAQTGRPVRSEYRSPGEPLSGCPSFALP